MRGGNSPLNRKLYVKMCFKHNPNILLLQEMKIQQKNQNKFKIKIWKDATYEANIQKEN